MKATYEDHYKADDHERLEKRHKKERIAFLNWLSDIDPSTNYNAAIAQRKWGLDNHTGDWLIRRNTTFETWQTEGNSLLWLNGKGK